MTDLISRQEAIEWVRNWIDVNKYYHPYSKCEYMPVNEVIDRLKQVPTIDAEPKWIPCSERPPEEGKGVIVQYGDGSLGIIERVRLKIWNLINSPYAKVVAWMPLPEPYREVSR